MQISSQENLSEIVRNMLEAIGEDASRPGLAGTPERIARMWKEIFRGYDDAQKPKITTFPNGEDGLRCRDIVTDSGSYYSMCEHHMMPFFGNYFFAYIPHPKGRILGLSKVARVVDYCAAKLQVQERLVNEILDMIYDALNDGEHAPLAMGLIMEGEHLCKSMRGIRKRGKMQSVAFRGLFEEPERRKEVLELYRNK